MSTGWETTSPRHEAKMTNGNSDHSSTTTTRRSSYVFIKELFTHYIILVHYIFIKKFPKREIEFVQ